MAEKSFRCPKCRQVLGTSSPGRLTFSNGLSTAKKHRSLHSCGALVIWHPDEAAMPQAPAGTEAEPDAPDDRDDPPAGGAAPAVMRPRRSPLSIFSSEPVPV